MAVLYLVIPDPALRSALAEQLNGTGMEILECAALSMPLPGDASAFVFEAALLDKTLLGALHDLRKINSKCKIFILGDINSELIGDIDDRVITESFPMPMRLGHLLARLQFHNQNPRAQSELLLFGSFRLDPSERQVVMQTTGAVIRLTEKETHLLEFLGRSKAPVPREELLAAIWGYDGRIDTHTLETHIYRLRRKLDPDGQESETIIASQGAYGLAAVKGR